MRSASNRSYTTLKPLFETLREGLRRVGVSVAKPIELKVHLAYDAEADCWYVAASDVPGLRLEADTPFALMERVAVAASELIELNEAEIVKKHVKHVRPEVSWKPVFDSPLQLAHA